LIINLTVFLAVWLLELLGFSGPSPLERFIDNFGLIPSEIIRGQRLHTLFTSMFIHGGPVHLIGNLLYLHIFGDNVEDAFGHKRYFFFFLASGVIASLVHVATLLITFDISSLNIPTIGASGAISGILGAYIVLYPRAQILTLLLFGWIYIVPIPAVFLLSFWFIFQLLYGLFDLEIGVPSGIAYWAHIGGFLAGLIFGLAWKKRRPKYDF
jgi:membrane associated rhomboid family serine protease